MVKVTRDFLQTEFGQLHVRIAGEGGSARTPLLCLHMTPLSGQDFEAFMALAGEDRLVIAPDYHGYGDSDPIKAEADATIEAYARSIWQALDRLNISEVDILGHHTGSKVAIEMALQDPQKVSGLICISLSTMTPEQYAQGKPSFKALSNQGSQNDFAKWWDDLKDYNDDSMPYDALVQKYVISLKSGPRFHWGFQASYHYNATIIEKLAALKTPTTIINPNDDLKAITPLAVNYIEGATLIDKDNWPSGFLDIKPKDVLETINLIQNPSV